MVVVGVVIVGIVVVISKECGSVRIFLDIFFQIEGLMLNQQQ